MLLDLRPAFASLLLWLMLVCMRSCWCCWEISMCVACSGGLFSCNDSESCPAALDDLIMYSAQIRKSCGFWKPLNNLPLDTSLLFAVCVCSWIELPSHKLFIHYTCCWVLDYFCLLKTWLRYYSTKEKKKRKKKHPSQSHKYWCHNQNQTYPTHPSSY